MVDPTPRTFDKQGGTVETAQAAWFHEPLAPREGTRSAEEHRGIKAPGRFEVLNTGPRTPGKATSPASSLEWGLWY